MLIIGILYFNIVLIVTNIHRFYIFSYFLKLYINLLEFINDHLVNLLLIYL